VATGSGVTGGPSSGSADDFGKDFWPCYPLGWLVTTAVLGAWWMSADDSTSPTMIVFFSAFGAAVACLPLVILLAVGRRWAASRWQDKVDQVTKVSSAAAAVVAMSVLVWSCTAVRTTSDTSPATASGSGSSTWSKPYGTTTCDDWLDVMSPAQRRSMAGDVLSGLRERNGGGSDAPSGSQIDEMVSAVSVGCAGETGAAGLGPTDQMAAYYLADEDLFGS
jgi:hypothetical protein